MKRRYWTEVELEMLRRYFANSHTRDLAVVLDRTPSKVLAKANAIGLRKSRDFIAQVARERTMAPGHGSHAHRIKPGTAPWNKGVRGVVGVQPQCRATQFKPGNRPVTWLPVGTYRVNADGVFERKFCDEPGPPTARWKAVSRLVWEEKVGPVPPGHIVVFRRGQKPERVDDLEAYTVERLECISRRENMARNTFHQYGPEVAQLVQLRGVLTRTINRATRKGGDSAQQDDE